MSDIGMKFGRRSNMPIWEALFAMKNKKIKVIDHIWIPLSEGIHLSAKVWLPPNAEEKPVPAILEYIPYRKNDCTALEDDITHTYFADSGYASVRVDLRGSGDSEGLLLDEYLLQEQKDALEVLSWLAAQRWCDGQVGMIGISWGGFNGLQVAAHQPPELKAIVTICSTDDRYTDDCHYMGGCVLGYDLLSWSSSMFVYNALPPDPMVVGDKWKDVWLKRLEEAPPFVEEWLSHQYKDDYWKNGSVAYDYSDITCAVYAVGGWADPYTNAIPRLLEELSAPRKGLIGPWAHQYPHKGMPGPTIDFLEECVRWWDYWLKGKDNGIMQEPILRAWISEYSPPRFHEPEWLGRWVTETKWPPENRRLVKYILDESRLSDQQEPERRIDLNEVQCLGLTAGVWCPGIGLPIDQRVDNGFSTCFTSPPVEEQVDILGFPEVQLKLTVDQPNALVSVRLCDLSPDGNSRLVTWGQLNLTHYKSDEEPEALVSGQEYKVKVKLNVVGYRLEVGHRWQVVLSPTYWPYAWPSPKSVSMNLFTGKDSFIILPIRDFKLPDYPLPSTFNTPPDYATLEHEWLRVGENKRNISYDVTSRELRMVDYIDEGKFKLNRNGLTYGKTIKNIYTIKEGEPLSAKVECERKVEISRGDWSTSLETYSAMTADENNFYLNNVRSAFAGEKSFFSKSWTKVIGRRHV